MKLKYIGIMAPIAIMLAAFLWAFDGVVLTPWVTDLGLSDVPTFVFMLHAVASVFLTYFLITRRSELRQLSRADWTAFGLAGLFGGALGTMAIVAAIIEVYSTGQNIAVVLLLQKLQPLFAILLALVWLKERPQGRFYVLAAVAVAGSFLLTFGFTWPNLAASGMLKPAVLALLAAFSFGSSTVFSKKAVTKVSHGMGTALRFLLTTGIMAVVIMCITALNAGNVNTGYAGIEGFSVISWELIGAFVVIALTTGGTAIFIYYWGLKRVLASRSTIYEMVFPVSAILLEFIIHDQILTIGQWVGAFIVFISIWLIVRMKSSQLTVTDGRTVSE